MGGVSGWSALHTRGCRGAAPGAGPLGGCVSYLFLLRRKPGKPLSLSLSVKPTAHPGLAAASPPTRIASPVNLSFVCVMSYISSFLPWPPPFLPTLLCSHPGQLRAFLLLSGCPSRQPCVSKLCPPASCPLPPSLLVLPASCRFPLSGFFTPVFHSLFSSPARAFLVAQMVKNLPAMQETRVPAPGQEDPLEKGMANHS